MARRIILVVAFHFLNPNLRTVVGTYIWYFFILEMQVKWWAHSNLTYCDLIWIFCTKTSSLYQIVPPSTHLQPHAHSHSEPLDETFIT